MNFQPNLDTLFNPKGIAVIGASTHPGKFGFVALHNILAAGFRRKCFSQRTQRLQKYLEYKL